MLRRQWWIVLLIPVVTVVATIVLLAGRPVEYRASTTLVVGESRVADTPSLAGYSLIRSMTTLIRSDLVARTVIRDLKLDLTPRALLDDLKVDVLPDSAVMNIHYTDTDPRTALIIIRQIARIFTSEVDRTLGVDGGSQTTPASGASGSGASARPQSFGLIVRVFDSPNVVKQPVATTSYVVFAGLAGAILGLLLAFGREALDSPIRRGKDAEEWFGAPVVGALPRTVGRKPPPGIGARTGRRRPRDVERVASLDLLRARIQFAQIGVAGPTILVTSAGPEADTSPVAASLGAALAWAGHRVVCVDAGIQHPTLHRSLGLPKGGPGLVEVLETGLDLDEVIVEVDLVQPVANGSGPSKTSGRLELLPAGGPPATLVGVLTPAAIATLNEQLRERTDYVVFNCPSLLVADALPLVQHSDNVLVVARSGHTTREQAAHVRETLEGLGVRKVGVVLTDASSRDLYA